MAIMMSIKPGLSTICWKKYTKEMVIKYLAKVRNTDVSNGGTYEDIE